MKNTLYVIGLLFLTFPLWAQTDKGRWTAGVSVGSFSYATSDFGYDFSASLTPSAGRFIATNFLIGLGVPFSVGLSRYTNPSAFTKNTNFSAGLSPYARYYVGSSRVKPFAGLGLSYSYISLRSETSPALLSTTKGHSFGLRPSIGLAYFINRTTSLNAEVRYNWLQSSLTGTDNSGTVYNNASYVTRNASLDLGFNIFFGE